MREKVAIQKLMNDEMKRRRIASSSFSSSYIIPPTSNLLSADEEDSYNLLILKDFFSNESSMEQVCYGIEFRTVVMITFRNAFCVSTRWLTMKQKVSIMRIRKKWTTLRMSLEAVKTKIHWQYLTPWIRFRAQYIALQMRKSSLTSQISKRVSN